MVGTETAASTALVALLATGKPFTPHRVKPLIAVPTTAGHRQRGHAAGRRSGTAAPARSIRCTCRETWPEAALVDPALTLSLPAGATLAAGLDALSHSLESIWNVNANPVSDTHAVTAARAVLATLPR